MEFTKRKETNKVEHTMYSELEIVYMIHPSQRRKGMMSMVLSFLKVKQQEWQKHIIATVSPENVDSIRLLQKWGIEKTEKLGNKETGEVYLKLSLLK